MPIFKQLASIILSFSTESHTAVTHLIVRKTPNIQMKIKLVMSGCFKYNVSVSEGSLALQLKGTHYICCPMNLEQSSFQKTPKTRICGQCYFQYGAPAFNSSQINSFYGESARSH